jgi:hypothetical protein
VAFKKYGDAVISQPVTAQASKKTAAVDDAAPATAADVEALLEEASKSPAPATSVKK